MKKISLILSLFLLITACKKDEKETIDYNLKSDYFSIENATFVENEYPAASGGASAPSIEDIYGNASIIPGGSNPIALNSSSDVNNILIGVTEANGFFRLPAVPSKSTDETYVFFIHINQNLEDDSFDIVIALEDASGNISQYETISVSLIQVGTGKLQVSCSWDQLNDVDLHLVEPSGAEIYFGNAISQNGGELDLDSNAACNIDSINNENITYSETDVVEAGEYTVRVDLWSNCDLTENTNYNVIAYYDGAIIGTSSGSNPYNGSFEPSDEDFGGSGAGENIMKFIVPSSKSNNFKYKFSFPQKAQNIVNLSPQKTN